MSLEGNNSERHRAIDQPLSSLMIETLHLAAVRTGRRAAVTYSPRFTSRTARDSLGDNLKAVDHTLALRLEAQRALTPRSSLVFLSPTPQCTSRRGKHWQSGRQPHDHTVPSRLIQRVYVLAVSLQVAILREGLTASGAGVWAVARMSAHVRRQAAGLPKGLAAGGAGVWAVTGMGAHVFREIAVQRERLAAGGAGAGAVASMGAFVRHQVTGRGEDHATGGAGAWAVA